MPRPVQTLDFAHTRLSLLSTKEACSSIHHHLAISACSSCRHISYVFVDASIGCPCHLASYQWCICGLSAATISEAQANAATALYKVWECCSSEWMRQCLQKAACTHPHKSTHPHHPLPSCTSSSSFSSSSPEASC